MVITCRYTSSNILNEREYFIDRKYDYFPYRKPRNATVFMIYHTEEMLKIN